jgi:hypothetical protein
VRVATFFPAAGTRGRLPGELTSFGYASKVIAHPKPAYDVTAQIEVVGSTATHFASGYTTVSTFVAENPRATVLDAKFRIGQNSGTPATDAGEYQVDDVVYGFGPTVNYDLGGLPVGASVMDGVGPRPSPSASCSSVTRRS